MKSGRTVSICQLWCVFSLFSCFFCFFFIYYYKWLKLSFKAWLGMGTKSTGKDNSLGLNNYLVKVLHTTGNFFNKYFKRNMLQNLMWRGAIEAWSRLIEHHWQQYRDIGILIFLSEARPSKQPGNFKYFFLIRLIFRAFPIIVNS